MAELANSIMTDLHKPLGKNGKRPSTGRGRLALYFIAAFLFAATVTKLVRNAVVDPNKVVAINQPTTEIEQPSPPIEVKKPTPQPASPKVTGKKKDTPDFKPQIVSNERRKPGAPDSELIETSDFGPLPKIGSSGLRPLDAYSAAPSQIGPARVAIVLGGLGISQTGTQNAIEKLPSSITLAFSPVGNSLQRWMQMARKQGHEIALQLAMQPLGYPSIDPGRLTLTNSASDGKNMELLRRSLGRVTNYPVVMNYLGAQFLNDEEKLRPILEELKQRGLGWLDDGTVQATTSLDLSEEIRLPHTNANFVLDGQRSASKIRAQLSALELYARRRGFAIATATAFPNTIKELAKWTKVASKNGIQIVPLSNLIRDYKR